MSDLAILFPEPERVMLGERETFLRPVPLEHFDAFGNLAACTLALLGNASVDSIHRFAEQNKGRLVTVLVGCTDLSLEEAQALPAPVAIQVLAQLIRVNSDFFAQALPSLVLALDGGPSSSG